jgi:hypothetical protein
VRIGRLGATALAVRARGVELFRYVYRPDMPPSEGPKPYLHPVRTLAGDVVTGYRPHDHRWHQGIQLIASHVSGQNFWGGATYVRDQGYVDLPNVGVMRHGAGERVLPPGESLRLRYRIVIANGTWDRERLESYAKEHPR